MWEPSIHYGRTADSLDIFMTRPVYEEHVAPALRVGYLADGAIATVTIMPASVTLAQVQPVISFAADDGTARISFGKEACSYVLRTEDARVKIGCQQHGKWVSIMLSLGPDDRPKG